MRRNNINAVLRLVRSYLDGKSGRLDLKLDFPYELERRYGRMYAEDPEYAELIYERLVKGGAYRWDLLSDEEFYSKVKEACGGVLDIAGGGFC